MPHISIDDEFRGLIPALSEEERTQLLANVMRDGCLDPLKGWKEERLLLDGHNRFDICEQNVIEFKIDWISLPDRNAAKDWIIKHQLGRRNLKPEQMAYLRGKKHEVEKAKTSGAQKGNKHAAKHGTQNESDVSRTRERVAEETGVSPATIQRNAKFAQAVDAIAEEGGDEAKRAILQGTVKMTDAAANAVAALTDEELKVVAKNIAQGKVDTVAEAISEAIPKSKADESTGHATVKGIGVIRANEALDILIRIPKKDPLRKRGFQIVVDWIKNNQ